MYSNEERNVSWIKNILSKFINIKTAVFFICAVGVFLVYLFSFSAPKDFPEGSTFYVKKGETLSTVSYSLKENGYIRSELFFKILVYCFDGKAQVNAGSYYFPSKENSIVLAYRINRGKYNNIPIKIIIPEGLNSKEIYEIISSGIPGFDKKYFIQQAQKKEGYLFPDTYVFSSEISVEDIISTMNKNFQDKISEKDIAQKIQAFGKSLSDVIKMASILEGEARLLETRRIVAGILWKRISLGMPLQVDTTFKYELGKTTFDLTTEDLKADSAYNSYTRLGLPPTPVSNPGIESILAAVTPIKTNYLYFLTDKKGEMHYATTHEGHVANKFKYLSH
jgi:UPF0755 protein